MNKPVDPKTLIDASASGGDAGLFGDYLRAAESWESETHRALRASRLRAWIAAAIASALALLSLGALVLMLPLKEYAPYVVEVDKSTGHIETMRPLALAAASPSEAIVEANLVRYVIARETYDPADLKQRYDEVLRLSSGDARADWRRLWTPDAPTNPAIAYGWGTRIRVTVKAVSLLKADTAALRYMLTRTDDRTGASTTSHWVAIVAFGFSEKPMRVRDRWDNPLGFEVSSFRADQEALGETRSSVLAPEALETPKDEGGNR